MVGVEDATRLGHVEVVGGALAPRHLEQCVEPAADPAVLGALVARPLEPVRPRVDRLPDRVRQVALVELGAVLGDEVAVAVAQLLFDRVELAAQQELSLLLLHPVGHVRADLVGHLELGERLTRPADDRLEARLDVEGLEERDLALDRQVRPPAGRVGQRTRLAHALQRLREAPGARGAVAISLTSARYSVASSRCPRGGIPRLGDGLRLDPQPRPAARHAHADHGAGQAAEHKRGTPVGRSPALSTRAIVPTRA